MFIEELSEFDFLDFGKQFDAYVTSEFNKDRTRAKVKFNLKEYVKGELNINTMQVSYNLRGISQVPEFVFSDFDVKGLNRSAAIFAGRVRDAWPKFMEGRFGEKYTEAYKQNNKQNYNNKDLLDF
ncbi:MAG: hypothetical protein J5779_02730 [Clostridia bacterium]|nr:hypothetical protein [Clostridia bacterium]